MHTNLLDGEVGVLNEGCRARRMEARLVVPNFIAFL